MNKPLAWLSAGIWSMMILQACTHLESRLISPDPARPSYELHGPNLLALKLEAGRLCPAGYDITRQWERQQRVEELGFTTRWWNKAMSAFESDDHQAEMAVACQAARP